MGKLILLIILIILVARNVGKILATISVIGLIILGGIILIKFFKFIGSIGIGALIGIGLICILS